jgi:phage gp29-like protein
MEKKILKPIATKSAFYANSLFNSLPNPNLTEIRYGNRLATLDNIVEDPHVYSTMQSRKAGVMSLAYEIFYDETNQHLKDYFESILKTINLRNFINNALDAVFYGYQVFEINWSYKKFNEQIFLFPIGVSEKPRKWFGFDSNNIPRLVNASNSIIPGYKFLLIQHNPSYTNPYGESILSKCLWPVAFKKGGFTFWLMLAEKLGVPHIVGKTNVPPGTDDYDAFIDALDGLIQDGSAVINSLDTIEAVNPNISYGTDAFDKLIDKCNLEISKAILSQTLTTEIGDKGSFAASNTHFDIKKEIAYSDKSLIESALNKLFKLVTEFNFQNVNPPTFEMYKEDDVDKPLAEFVDILTKNNQIKFTKEFYINRFNFKDEEFELIENQTQPTQPMSNEPTIQDKTIVFAETKSEDWSQILIDTIGDKVFEENPDILKPILLEVEKFINSQKDFKSAIEGLGNLLPNISTEKFEEVLTRIMFISDVIGRLSVQEEVKQNG